MKNKKLKIVLFSVFGGLFLLIIVFVFSIYLLLFVEVRKVCIKGQNEFKTNCIDSLALVIESNNKTIKEKNDAIWTLGQIANKRSLPVLKKIYTGKIPDREPLDKVISQYEIKKAIRWIEHGNWTSWMYFKFR